MEYVTCRLNVGKRAYYAFENTSNHEHIKCWVFKKYIFDTLVTLVLLYGVVAFLNLLGKCLKMSKNIFLQSFYKLRNKWHTPSLRRDHIPLISWPWKGSLNTFLRFKKVPYIKFLELHGKQAKRLKRPIKTKLCSSWMQDMEKLFDRWDATPLLHDAPLDSSINEVFLQRQCIITWEKCGGSRFTHYTTHVAPNYKTIFFGK